MSRISKIRFTDTFQMTHSSKKTKMLTKSVCKVDDYEKFQPCFMSDDSEEFYSLNTPTPSEDIWKKFELLPTPPRSPKREPFDFNLDYDIGDISSFLNDDIFVNPIAGDLPFPESPPIHSKLIQDCMWSGSHKGNDLAENSKPSEVNLDVTTSSDCVDPTAVFPYPINDTKVHSLGTETPSDSEEEEVDVVSTGDEKFTTQAVQVDHQINTQKNKSCVQRTPVKCTSVKIEPKPVVSNSDCAAISVHNYSLPYSHGIKRSRSTHTQHVVSHKRVKREQTEPVLKSVALKLKSTHNDLISDSEESCEGKRTQHNVLERKRRNDLKDSFFVLRDNVPELDSKEKAPKVLILRKASEYILSLRRLDVKYVKELNTLQQQNEMLRKRLEELEAETDSDEEYSI